MAAGIGRMERLGRLRILVTGRDGQVGHELVRTLAPLGEVTATGRAELDMTSDDSIRASVRRVRPHLIVNAAAYTAVDKAESEPALAKRINSDAVATLAAEAKRAGAGIIHYSTDYVFDGAKSEPYLEDDRPNPLNVYGRTKLGGDEALAAADLPYIIFRVSWVYGARGRNFLHTMLRLAKERRELRIVDDQIGAPTSAIEIADATAQVVRKLIQPRDAPSDWNRAMRERSGVYNMAAAGETSWCGFAHEIFRQSGVGNVAVHPISTAEYKTPAVRPLNSRLGCARLERVFGLTMKDWKAALEDVLHEISSASIARPH